MKYIVITAQNRKSHYLARQKIGGGYGVIATFLEEGTAKHTAELLNSLPDTKPINARFGKSEPAFEPNR